MAKDKGLIDLEGEIVDVMPNQMYKVQFENGHVITAYTAGKLKQFKIRMIVGDKVKVELSPYDLDRGRITYRL